MSLMSRGDSLESVQLCVCNDQSHILPEFFTSFYSKLFLISLSLPQYSPASPHIPISKLVAFIFQSPGQDLSRWLSFVLGGTFGFTR